MKNACTPKQRSNLRKLADYLSSGKLKAEFDMELYSDIDEYEERCGSVGCAIGHGPFAGIPKMKEESFSEYGDRAFIPAAHESFWIWLFHPNWSDVDIHKRERQKEFIGF